MKEVTSLNEKANLTDKLAQVHEYWSPRIIGEMNDYKLQVGKVKGEFVWHTHAETDEFFLVLKGHLTIQLRDRKVELDEGELFVVPRTVEHCPEPTSRPIFFSSTQSARSTPATPAAHSQREKCDCDEERCLVPARLRLEQLRE